MRAFQQDSPNLFMYANQVYKLVKTEGLKPWIDKKKSTLGDNLSREVLLALKSCKAIISIVTRGYARTIQCVREFYYFALLHPNQPCYSIMSDFRQIEHEQAGKWLIWKMTTLGCFNYRDAVQLIGDVLKLKVQICQYRCGFLNSN